MHSLTRLLVIATLAIQSQPAFRSGVELIRVDVTVVDNHGRPVRDLQASDFVVRIHGKPRDVRFARFYGPDEVRPAGPAPATAASAPHGTASNVASSPGRVVMIVVDRESLRPGSGGQLLDSVAAFIQGLSPQDAVGLVPIPGATIDPTREHQRVAEAVKRALGAEPKRNWRFNLSLREANDWEERDARRTSFLVERECRPHDVTCPQELRLQAFEMLRDARDRARQIVSTLAAVAEGLASIEHPKQLVFISGGLAFDTETHTWYRDFARKAAAAQMTVYTIELDQPPTDASSGFSFGPTVRDRELQEGLTTLAGLTGGAFFSAVGTGSGILDRVRTELENVYQLGLDGAPEDADGKPHEIRVEVKRPGVTVRARREVIVPAGAGAQRNPLAGILRQPVDVTDLPVAVGAFTARGDEPDTLKVILVGEAAQAAGARLPIQYGFIVLKDGKPTHEIVDRFETQPTRSVTAVQLAPGTYRLRFGAVDADRRGGSVDLPLRVGLRAAGDLQFSDLFVGTLGSEFKPAVTAAQGTRLMTMLELYTMRPEVFDDTSVVLEVRNAESAEPLATAEGLLRPTDSERRQVAEGPVPTGGLQPGTYTVSATISVAGTPIGKVTRGFILTDAAVP